MGEEGSWIWVSQCPRPSFHLLSLLCLAPQPPFLLSPPYPLPPGFPPQVEVNFLDYIVIPLWERVAEVLQLQPALDRLMSNRERWECRREGGEGMGREEEGSLAQPRTCIHSCCPPPLTHMPLTRSLARSPFALFLTLCATGMLKAPGLPLLWRPGREGALKRCWVGRGTASAAWRPRRRIWIRGMRTH